MAASRLVVGLNSGETFTFGAGTPVNCRDHQHASGRRSSIDNGVAVTSAAALVMPSGAALQVNGSLTANGTAVTLNGGTLSGYGTITGLVSAGSGPHTIAPQRPLAHLPAPARSPSAP